MCNFLMIPIVILLCVWAFFSGIEIRSSIVYSICLGLGVLVTVTSGSKLKLRQSLILWIPAILMMFLYADNFSIQLMAFNTVFVVFLFLITIFYSVAEKINVQYIIKIMVLFSSITLLFLASEFVLGNTMRPVLVMFLSGERLHDELEALKMGSRYIGLASSANISSFCAIILISYSLYLLKGKEKIKKIAIITFSTFVIMIVGGRSNLIVIPLTFVISSFVQKKQNGLNYGLRLVFGLLFGVVLWVLLSPYLTQYLIQIRLFERAFDTFGAINSGEDFSNGRLVLYAKAVSLWLDSPVFGNGWYYFYNHNIGILRAATNSHVHNLILELLCDCGVIGMIVILVPLISTYLQNIASLKQSKMIYKNILLFSLTIQTFFFLDSLLHVTFYSFGVITIYFLTILIFYVTLRKASRNCDNNLVPRKL